jgi:uncharacterized protein YpmS
VTPRTRKILRRIVLTVLLVLAVKLAVVSVGVMLFRGTPEWYHPRQLDPAVWEQAAQSATNKLATIHNEAARIRRDERMAERSKDPAPTAATAPITVSFTEDELNAFFDKWAGWNEWKAKYESHITDPVILLDNGRIILAAKVKDLNTVASLHFEPRITRNGELDLQLVRILGGNLPLPEMVLSTYQNRLRASLLARLPRWRQTAKMDSSGAPNMSAVAAEMSTLALHMLSHEPAEAVLFLPMMDAQLKARSVPVRLTDVQIAGHTLTLQVRPMSASEREELLRRMREGPSVAQAGGG